MRKSSQPPVYGLGATAINSVRIPGRSSVSCLPCRTTAVEGGKHCHMAFKKRRLNFKAIETNMTDLSIAWGYLEDTKQPLTKTLFNEFEQKFYLWWDIIQWGVVCGQSLHHVWPCDSMDYNPPGSSVHGILPTRILVWVAISSSRGPSRPRDQTRVSCVSCIGRRILYLWATWGD